MCASLSHSESTAVLLFPGGTGFLSHPEYHALKIDRADIRASRPPD